MRWRQESRRSVTCSEKSWRTIGTTCPITPADIENSHALNTTDRIATAVANALDHAHRHKVIHRDIKPANILLQDGERVVADFGIALAVGAAGGNRLTETGLGLGTPFYMSPEQATGDQPGGPSRDFG